MSSVFRPVFEGLSPEQARVILDERRGAFDRFRIEFKPRLGFQLLSEERVISLVHGALAILPDWSVESVAFLPVDGDVNGIVVTVKRTAPTGLVVKGASILAVTPLAAFVAIIGVIAIFYSVHTVKRLGLAVIEGSPGSLPDVAAGFKFGALALLAGVGFFVYKAVT